MSLAASRRDLVVEEGDGDSVTLQVAAPIAGEAILLRYRDGEIWTRNPDRETLEIMLDLAGRLGARVRGDELETYRTPDESYVHPDDRPALEKSRIDVRAMRRRARLISYTWFACAALLAGMIGFAVDRCTT